jgi:tRNA dimethylallyltransferase
MYYATSILFQDQLLANNNHHHAFNHSSKKHPYHQEIHDALESQDPKIMYSLLQKCDPLSAQKWHPNDTRKIKRSLEIAYTTGVAQSMLISLQKTMARFRTMVFWPFADLNSLYPKLDARVDDMVSQGLFGEISEMRQLLANQHQCTIDQLDYTRGILQAIGFKEFKDYLSALEQSESNASKDEHKLSHLKESGLEEMKRNTRQYARRQVTWLKNKLVPQVLESNQVGMAILEATGMSLT